MRIRSLSRPLSGGTRRRHHDIASIRAEMLSRRPKSIHDALSPVPSHLLNISLSDYVPAQSYPPNFTPDPADPQAHLVLPKPPGSTATTTTTLPQGHHMVYFPPQIPPSRLLPDGTDPDHQPPGGAFTRRVWGGGGVRFLDGWRDALKLDGRRAVCVESIGDVGSRGAGPDEKIVVDVMRRYGLDDDGGGGGGMPGVADRVQREPLIEERRRLVFMKPKTAMQIQEEAAAAAAAKNSRVLEVNYIPEYTMALTPRPSLLFHFSALTFNAHAIHLDPQYSREVEGHRGLLVHGPLTLMLMFSAFRARLGGAGGEAVRRIEYRNLAPLYVGERLTVNIRRSVRAGAGVDVEGYGSEGERKWDIWLEGPDGGLAVKGVAVTSK